MINEVIILAGGMGTRLQSVVSDVSKCMAPVNGKPFLYYVIEHLKSQGINKYIFSLGYKSESIVHYINKEFSALDTQYSIEESPLGTGGAIKLASIKASGKDILVVNGDTLFSVNIKEFSEFHKANKSDCTLCLKPMTNFDRYGVVETSTGNRITSFKEKKYYKEGVINGGVYALGVPKFMEESLPGVFSFEKDYLEEYVTRRSMFGMKQDAYFIDIGIPEDYKRAQKELA